MEELIIPITDISYRLGIAFLCGCLIGIERERRHRRTGLRTTVLVCLGAAGFVIFADLFPEEASPTRIAAQIVSGIGFLCGGVIFKEGLSVHGLNSAATIWCASTVGVFCGGGYFFPAFVLTCMLIVVNITLRQFEEYFDKTPLTSGETVYYELVVDCFDDNQELFRDIVVQEFSGNNEVILKKFYTDIDKNANLQERHLVKIHCIFKVKSRNDEVFDRLVSQLLSDENVLSAFWELRPPSYNPVHAH